MQELFEQLSEAQVFDELVVIMHARLAKAAYAKDLDWEVIVNGLADRVGRRGWTSFQKEEFNRLRRNESRSNDYTKVAAAVWRFVNRGWAYPTFVGGHSSGPRAGGLRLTALGEQVCSVRPDDSPSRLGFFERLRGENTGVDEEVFERLIDASACLDSGLARPAVVMLGVAAEVTTAQAFRTVRTLNLTKAKEPEFKEQLVAIVAAIDSVAGLNSEQKHRLHMACVSIETIRVLRNNASHHGNPNPESLLVHDQITSACIHLPLVWRHLILPNRA